MPINLVGLRVPVSFLCGVGWCLLTANFPLVEFEFKSSGLGSVSASISYPSGFVFPPPFGGGLNIYGEFDPGSGRTLAACLTHASRTVIRVLVPGDQWRTGE
jgi:hypothetical protein